VFKIYYRGAPASLEQGTESVPDDGRYYLLANGQIVDSFRTIGKAKEAYRQLLADMGFQPETRDAAADGEEIRRKERMAVDHYRVSDYWDEAYHHRGGGKLRNR
jgi:thioredoxin-like negative regulator of GroEL